MTADIWLTCTEHGKYGELDGAGKNPLNGFTVCPQCTQKPDKDLQISTLRQNLLYVEKENELLREIATTLLRETAKRREN